MTPAPPYAVSPSIPCHMHMAVCPGHLGPVMLGPTVVHVFFFLTEWITHLGSILAHMHVLLLSGLSACLLPTLAC